MAEKKRQIISVSQAAWRACRAHGGDVAALTALQVLCRLAVLLPLMIHRTLAETTALPSWPFWILSFLFYLLLVLPMRFQAGEKLRFFSGPKEIRPRGGKPYFSWLKTGLLRHIRGWMWGLPLMVCVGYFVYGWSSLPFTVMWKPVLTLGLPLSGALMAAFALLFVYGWWRDLPVEYLPVRYLDCKKTYFFCRRARKMGKGKLGACTAVNVLLSLPGAVGFAAVLIPYALKNLPSSSNIQLIISSLQRLMRSPLPRAQVSQLLGVYLVLYLPLCVFRKMRNAVLIRRLTKECSGLGGENAAG